MTIIYLVHLGFTLLAQYLAIVVSLLHRRRHGKIEDIIILELRHQTYPEMN
jgi:hypothetical protein